MYTCIFKFVYKINKVVKKARVFHILRNITVKNNIIVAGLENMPSFSLCYVRITRATLILKL